MLGLRNLSTLVFYIIECWHLAARKELDKGVQGLPNLDPH